MKASQRSRETQGLFFFFFFLIKSLSFSSDIQADNGPATRRSQVSELSCFTSGLISCLTQIERDEGSPRGVARLRKEALSGGYWARMLCGVIWKQKNPRKQLQLSSSWVTVVTFPTNPLTHLLDRYLALDSISRVWLGRDKRPLLRLWYPNERGSEAYVWFCLVVKIRDKR